MSGIDKKLKLGEKLSEVVALRGRLIAAGSDGLDNSTLVNDYLRIEKEIRLRLLNRERVADISFDGISCGPDMVRFCFTNLSPAIDAVPIACNFANAVSAMKRGSITLFDVYKGKEVPLEYGIICGKLRVERTGPYFYMNVPVDRNSHQHYRTGEQGQSERIDLEPGRATQGSFFIDSRFFDPDLTNWYKSEGKVAITRNGELRRYELRFKFNWGDDNPVLPQLVAPDERILRLNVNG